MSKVGRFFEYVKSSALIVLLKPVVLVAKAFNPRLRRIWLISERGNEARDNGYWFYRYMVENHKEERCIFVITKDSPDYDKIARLGGETVQFRSFRHYFLYSCAAFLVSTHVVPAAPDLVLYRNLAKKGLRVGGKQVFLKHGIVKDNMTWNHYPNLKVDIYVAGAQKEYEYLRDVYNHPKGVVQYLGLCRFDNLMNAPEPENMILVMPTWRGARYPKGDAFEGTDFYKAYQSLLESPQMDAFLEKNGMKMVFYPHVEIQKELHRFHTNSSNIILADKNSYDVQDLLMRCRVLITDFSSVYFDVAYMGKPMVFYQFDEQEFRKVHYQEGYFNYRRDGFGAVVTEESDVLKELDILSQNGFRPSEEYQRRINEFFPKRDKCNCQRTYEAIKALKDKGEAN